MAFKGGNVIGIVNFNATGAGTTAIGATSNSGTINIGNASSGIINIDCGTAGINIGATSIAHTTIVGSTNSTSATTVQSGSGALNITSTNGAQTHNSGTGTMSISTDALATTVNIATGAAVKTATFGSTNTTSATTINSGSGGITATGVVGTSVTTSLPVFIGSTGKLGTSGDFTQAFSYYLASTTGGVTGNSVNYTILFDTALVASANYNTGTGTFTAPATGTYFFQTTVAMTNISATMTYAQLQMATSAHAYTVVEQNPFATATVAIGQQWCNVASIVAPMTINDTLQIQILILGGAANTAQVQGSAGGGTVFSMISGYRIA